MDQVDDIPIKREEINNEDTSLEEKEVKLEQDVPEYVNVTLFSNTDDSIGKITNEIYTCDQCHSKYKKMEYLTIHYASHSVTKLCPVCNEVISHRKKLKSHLNRHIKDEMEKQKGLVCSYCQKTFSTNKSFVIHTRVHTNERPYKCEICGEGFKQAGSLKVHYVTHTKERQFVCEICSGSYTTASSLKRHKRRIHDKGKVLKCRLCDAQMYNMADFKSHNLNVHPGRGYKRTCYICSEDFFTRFKFKEHYRLVHHDQFIEDNKFVIKSIPCILCGERFSTNSLYAEHRRMHLGYTEEELELAKENKTFKCKLCSKKVKARDSLYKHMESHMEKKFECNRCNKFYSYFKLKVHTREVHQTKQCRICSKVVFGSKSLRCHYTMYHQSATKNFSCSICGRQYIMRYKLDLHMQVHKQKAVKNCKCIHCGKRFLFAYTLEAHLAKSHRMKLKHKCNVCGITFNNRKELLGHKRSHNKQIKKKNENPKNKQDKPLQCEICMKIFKLHRNYKTHLSSKSCVDFIRKVRDKRCNICFKYLTNRETFKSHMELHSGIEFKCRICGQAYKKASAERRHMRRCHPEDKVYWCYRCSNGFDRVSELNAHNKIHKVKQELLEDDNCFPDGGFSSEIKTEAFEVKKEPEALDE